MRRSRTNRACIWSRARVSKLYFSAVFDFNHFQHIMGTELRAYAAVFADYGFFLRVQMDSSHQAGFYTVSAAIADLFFEIYSSPLPFGKRAKRACPHARRVYAGMADDLRIRSFDPPAGLYINSAVFQRYSIIPGSCAGHHTGVAAYTTGRICDL